jgi:hypothetical protein
MNDELTAAALRNLALWMQHHDQQMQELLRRIPEAGVTVIPKKPPKPVRVPHVPRAVVNVATGQEYPSPAAACRACGASRSNMAMHLKGYHKTIKGQVFHYKDASAETTHAPATTQPGTSATAGPQAPKSTEQLPAISADLQDRLNDAFG